MDVVWSSEDILDDYTVSKHPLLRYSHLSANAAIVQSQLKSQKANRKAKEKDILSSITDLSQNHSLNQFPLANLDISKLVQKQQGSDLPHVIDFLVRPPSSHLDSPDKIQVYLLKSDLRVVIYEIGLLSQRFARSSQMKLYFSRSLTKMQSKLTGALPEGYRRCLHWDEN